MRFGIIRKFSTNPATIFALLFFCAFLVSFAPPAGACSDIQIMKLNVREGDIVVSARTMDFSIDLASDIKIVPRGVAMTSNAPGGAPGLSWTSLYGFVGVNALDMEKYNDGLNEKGLSVGTLWLDPSEYPTPTSAAAALSIHDIGAWILGNFATVDEVKAALADVAVWGEFSLEVLGVPPLHLAIHDAQGKNLVVEFQNGETRVYDNPAGVLTNGPAFDWQLVNLAQYMEHLKEYGTLPSSLSSVSRFVALSTFRKELLPPESAREAIQFLSFIMGRVSGVPGEDKWLIPLAAMKYSGSYTQWTVFRDHANLVLYYRTALNGSLRAINLKKLDFSPGRPIITINMENDGAQWYAGAAPVPR